VTITGLAGDVDVRQGFETRTVSLSSRKEALLARTDLGSIQFGKTSQDFLLLFAYGFRGGDVYHYDQIPATPASQVGHTFARNPEILAGLSPLRDIQVIGSFQSRYFDFTAKRGKAVSDGTATMMLSSSRRKTS